MEKILPDHGIVFFDGICVLCNKSVDFLIRNEREDQLRFASFQSKTATHMLNSDQNSQPIPGSILYYENGLMYEKSTAVLKIMKKLRHPWPVLSILFIIPRPLRDWMYDIIAKNRYRWFGKSDHCRVPADGQNKILV